ncbi:MAG: hypothetical protein O6700_07740, partial [Gammaproteobacteria bacterium]|nr:hypothetical protein [Gammaproteobacteria bacterium]
MAVKVSPMRLAITTMTGMGSPAFLGPRTPGFGCERPVRRHLDPMLTLGCRFERALAHEGVWSDLTMP